MLCVGGTAAVAKEQDLASRPQTHDNQTGRFKDRGAAIAGNYYPKLGPFAQRGVNQVDSLFSIHLQQDFAFTETEASPLTFSLGWRSQVEPTGDDVALNLGRSRIERAPH